MLIGYGSLVTTLLFSSRGRPRLAAASCLQIGKLWPSGLISRKNLHATNYQKETVAFNRVVAPARAILGAGNLEVPPRSGWDLKDFNINDPVEVALAASLQKSALPHVAESTSGAYVGPLNAFVAWCVSLLRPRRSFPAEDLTVTLYIHSLMDSANSFSTIKSASAATAFFHKIIVFANLPIMAPEVCMLRTTTARKFGISAKHAKDPFLWFQLVDFALLYGIHNQGYCHLVVSTMTFFFWRHVPL